MTYDQIVKLWKTGYSKLYLYEFEYNDLRKNSFFEKYTNEKLKERARKNIESTLESEFKKSGYNFN